MKDHTVLLLLGCRTSKIKKNQAENVISGISYDKTLLNSVSFLLTISAVSLESDKGMYFTGLYIPATK